MHTGEATWFGAGYVGLAVHEAARVAAVAHGGQVLVSGATAALVGDTLAPGTSLRDLGEHRLKDLARPARLFQVEAAGLRQAAVILVGEVLAAEDFVESHLYATRRNRQP